MTVNSGHWIIPTGTTLNINDYNNNGWKFGYASAYTRIPCDVVPSKPFVWEYEITEMNPSYTSATLISSDYFANNYPNKIVLYGKNNSQVTVYNGSIIGKYSMKVYSDVLELYKDGIKLGQVAITDATTQIMLETGVQSNRYMRIKNVKFKPL